MKDFQKEKKNRILYKILVLIIIIGIIYNILYIVSSMIFNHNYISIGKLNFYITREDSLNNEIGKKCFLVIKEVSENELEKDDLIACENNNELSITKIGKINEVGGKKYFVTKADKNLYYDSTEKNIENIAGKVVYKNSILGLVLSIFESKVVSFLILIFLILYYIYKKDLEKRKATRKNKKNSYYV